MFTTHLVTDLVPFPQSAGLGALWKEVTVHRPLSLGLSLLGW